MSKDQTLVKHILEAIGKIERYIAGMDFDSFAQDEKTVDAVVRELTVIGEAAANISEDFEAKNNHIAFYEAKGMRNRIVHEYWSVDEKVVWTTCQSDLKELKEQLKNS